MLEYCTATRGAEKSDYPRLFCCWGLHDLNGQDTSAELDALTAANDAVAQGCGLTDEQAQ